MDQILKHKEEKAMDVMEAVILSTPDKKAKYDAVLKQLIANKQILARIMKRFVPEFENCSLKDIEEKYILSGEISVSKVGVQKNTTNQMVERTRAITRVISPMILCSWLNIQENRGN